MTIEKAMFILKHGSSESLTTYLQAIKVVEEYMKQFQKIKSEAIRDFAEKLKENAYREEGYESFTDMVVTVNDIDRLVDEIMEEES